MKKIVELSDTKDNFSVLSDKNKKIGPTSLVFQTINYSDEKVIEKIKTFEDINKDNISKDGAKKIAYMSLFL